MAPLIVITGPTASGKTGLALELAERYSGEIICADSRTIYKGVDIGTAKPTANEQAMVPHHLIDVVEPGERYTAADFQKDANAAIEMIRNRGNIPFVVGGTGLYIDALVREYEWPERSKDDDQKQILEASSLDELHAMIKKQHLAMPENIQNKRHLVNTLLRVGVQGKSLSSPQENTHVVAIATEKNILDERIRNRATEMFKSGVIEETEELAKRYGWDSEAMSSNIYPIIKQVIEGEISDAEAIELFITKDRQLAKRQITWLKRYDYVRWLDLDEARAYIETLLQ